MMEGKIHTWLFRWKLYHLPLWIAYEIGASVLFSDQLGLNWESAIIVLFYIIGHATGSYFNIYYLVPQFLKQKKYGVYLIGFMGNLALSPLLILIGFWIAFQFDWEIMQAFLAGDIWFPAVYASSFSTILAVMILKLSKEWIAERQKSQVLEKEKLETELKFLRSQYNPHFLFNTINSIFFLIRKDQERASDALAKFSDLLRYQLYECNEPTIPLQKEVAFLRNFIELEQLRHETALEVRFCTYPKDNLQGAIAPFLLMPFIENAFKHVSKGKDLPHFIQCKLHLENQTLQFEVENSAHPKQDSANSPLPNPYGGIGLENVRRRLTLLYPERHSLLIQAKEHSFYVHLTLQL